MFYFCSHAFMTRLSLDAPTPEMLGTIAQAIEDAPSAYRQQLASASDRQRLRAADALAGWIGARLSGPITHHDVQLALPIETQRE